MTAAKVLVTGSNGFIGSSIVEQLLNEQSYQIFGLSKGENRNPYVLPKHYSEVNLEDKVDLEEALQNTQPDIIIHCAAISQVDKCEADPEKCYRVNTRATQLITDYADSNNVKLVFLSTDFVFDGKKKWQEEEAVVSPISVYGKSKSEAEAYIQNSKVEWAIIRPILVYGFSKTAMRSNIFTWVYQSVKENCEIEVVTDQLRTPTYIQDVVLLVKDILKTNSKGIFHIGGSEKISVYDFAIRVAELSGGDVKNINPSVSDNVKGAFLRPNISCFRVKKIKSKFNWVTRNVDEGIVSALDIISKEIT